MPSCRVIRPQDELIAQKSGRRPIFLTQSHHQPLFFNVKYPLTSKNSFPILPAIESNVLSNQTVKPITQRFAVAQRRPSPVRYPGMPAERYWEFEDGRVNLAGAEAGVTDLLRMSVTEFVLSFGNDWFVTPVRLPVGWLYKVNSFEITDSFGITSPVEAI